MRDGHQVDNVMITICAEADGTCLARHVDIINDGVTLRVSFGKAAPIDSAFVDEMVPHLKIIVKSVLEHRGVLSMPDMRIRVRNLVMAGCRAMISEATEGADHVLIRFRLVFGNLNCLFRRDIMVSNSAVTESFDISIQAMEKALLPIFDLGSFIRNAQSSGALRRPEYMEQILDVIEAKIHSIEYSYYYLRRLLAEEQSGMVSDGRVLSDTAPPRSFTLIPGDRDDPVEAASRL